MLFLKGIICGIGIIIPGFSFSSLALLMNIYDDLLFAINNIFKEPKKSLKILMPFMLGTATACFILFYPLNYLLNTFPLVLIMFFSGLLIGGFLPLLKSIKAKDLLISLLSFIVFLALNYFLNGRANVDLSNLNLSLSITLLIVGMSCAFASLAPSLSITFILMTFGLYTPIMDFIDSILKMDIKVISNFNIWINLLSLGAFFVSFIFICAKFISFLIKKHQSKTLAFFLGSSYATLGSIFLNSSVKIIPVNKNFNLWYYYAVSVFFLLFGLILILKLEKKKE